MKNILIVSHERSGTHFLMNTISLNFDKYEYGVWHDFPSTIDSNELNKYLNGVKEDDKIYKSHHQAFNFDIKELTDKFHVFYMVRDGRDVLTSTYHHFKKHGWINDLDFYIFMRTSLKGIRKLWYDYIKTESMVHRWVIHIEGWLLLENQINIIRYEDLSNDFNNVLKRIGTIIDQEPKSNIKPTLKHSTVDPRKGIIGDYKNIFSEYDLEYFEQVAGKTNESLCYRGII